MKDSKFRVRQHILCFASISRKRTPRRRFESLATLSNRLSPRCQVSAGDFLFSYSKHSITAVAITHTSSSSFHKHFHITCSHFYFDEISVYLLLEISSGRAVETQDCLHFQNCFCEDTLLWWK